jgi:hypothetical protein
MITMENLKQNGAEMFKAGSEAGYSGPVSWDDLTDKPFVSRTVTTNELGDLTTLSWDGTFGDKPCLTYNGMSLY